MKFANLSVAALCFASSFSASLQLCKHRNANCTDPIKLCFEPILTPGCHIFPPPLFPAAVVQYQATYSNNQLTIAAFINGTRCRSRMADPWEITLGECRDAYSHLTFDGQVWMPVDQPDFYVTLTSFVATNALSAETGAGSFVAPPLFVSVAAVIFSILL